VQGEGEEAEERKGVQSGTFRRSTGRGSWCRRSCSGCTCTASSHSSLNCRRHPGLASHMSTWCAEATPGTSAVASLARERPSTAAVSPTRDRGEGDLKATVGSVTVKAGLSVSGRLVAHYSTFPRVPYSLLQAFQRASLVCACVPKVR